MTREAFVRVRFACNAIERIVSGSVASGVRLAYVRRVAPNAIDATLRVSDLKRLARSCAQKAAVYGFSGDRARPSYCDV